MTILVNWHAAALATAGLTVLLGLTWLLRGARAAVLTCAVIGAGMIVLGVAAGNSFVTVAGVIDVGVVIWYLWPFRAGSS